MALGFLREAARSGYPCVALFERDPLLDPLRVHGDFRDLMRALHVERDGCARLYAELGPSRSLPKVAPPNRDLSDAPQA